MSWKYEFRVADLSRVDKTKEDFWNEEEERYNYHDEGGYLDYLYDNNAFLTEEEADKVLNELHDENKQLKQQLNYIQNSISKHIKHQKTELGQKTLKEIIKDYNEWLLGHKEVKE